MMTKSLVVAAGIAALASWTSAADAATTSRNYLSHGTANCQSALPVFDVNIRKRPYAVANEGDAGAFVTCDSESINNGGTGFTGVGMFFRNRAGTDGVTINCTLVDAVFTPLETFPKTSAAIPAGATGAIQWTAAGDNAGANFLAPAVSCILPPGVDISFTNFIYPEEIGT
jgi:hypothetical protein